MLCLLTVLDAEHQVYVWQTYEVAIAQHHDVAERQTLVVDVRIVDLLLVQLHAMHEALAGLALHVDDQMLTAHALALAGVDAHGGRRRLRVAPHDIESRLQAEPLPRRLHHERAYGETLIGEPCLLARHRAIAPYTAIGTAIARHMGFLRASEVHYLEIDEW